MLVREIMSAPVISIPEDASVADAAREMLERRIGGLVVVDPAGNAVGYIAESDFAAQERGVPFSLFRAPQVLGQWIGDDGLEAVYRKARDMPVRDALSTPLVTAREDDQVDRVAQLMMQHDTNHVVVVRDRKPVGVVARHDLLRLFAKTS